MTKGQTTLQIKQKIEQHESLKGRFMICSTCRKHFPVLSSFTTYYRACNQINTMGGTRGAETTDLSGGHEFTPGFQLGSYYSIFSFICMFCRQLFILLYFFFWALCCLFFFDIWGIFKLLLCRCSDSCSKLLMIHDNYGIPFKFKNKQIFILISIEARCKILLNIKNILYVKIIKSRYLICCACGVSETTFIRYA